MDEIEVWGGEIKPKEFITFNMTTGSTAHPTLTVPISEWFKAIAELEKGGKPVIYGSIGGHGCRGGSIPGRMAKVTLISLENEHGCIEGEDSMWGKCWLSERY